jgi:hypothetical protein
MRDAIGNKITEHSILGWHPDAKNGVVCQVAHVSDGGISVGDSGEKTPPMLVIQIMIPIEGVPPGREPVLGQFMVLMNPNAEAAVERMLEGQRRQ